MSALEDAVRFDDVSREPTLRKFKLGREDRDVSMGGGGGGFMFPSPTLTLPTPELVGGVIQCTSLIDLVE